MASARLAETSSVSGDPNSEEAAIDYLDSSTERLPKRQAAWWLPPHNLALNQTLLGGYNLWRFTILPLFPKNKAYNERLQGIVIHPSWWSVDRRTLTGMDLDLAKKLVGAMNQAPTVQEDVRREMAWIEREFSIVIPEAVQAKIIKDALPTAKRRWSVDRLRLKDRLVPLDGGPVKDL